LFCGNAIARDTELTRPTLKGLKGVYGLVESFDEDIVKDGLTVKTIKTDVELKLRLAGIPVLSLDEFVTTVGSADLYVNASVLKYGQRGYIYSVEVAVLQGVSLLRSPGIKTLAETWSVNMFGTAPDLKDVRESIKDQVDQFINAYLSVNPKQ